MRTCCMNTPDYVGSTGGGAAGHEAQSKNMGAHGMPVVRLDIDRLTLKMNIAGQKFSEARTKTLVCLSPT
jgi:hypothetical protein